MKKINRWQLMRRIEKIINDNCEDIPWEGTEVDKLGLREDILNLIDELMENDELMTDK